MADQHARQERVGIDPDLAVFPNRANLHADLVGMADDHQLEHVVLARMRVQYHTSVALELMQVPARRGKAFEIGLENAIGHGALQAYGRLGAARMSRIRRTVRPAWVGSKGLRYRSW